MPRLFTPPRRLITAIDRVRDESLNAGIGGGEKITFETVQAVLPNAHYLVQGVEVPATGDQTKLNVGDEVPVAWKNGQPVAIIQHSARRTQFVAPQLLGGPIVEELFIAVNPKTTKLDVWFRNDKFVVVLDVRGSLPADPQDIVWGADRQRFVVRTGVGVPNQRYHVFKISRRGDKQLASPPKVTFLQSVDPTVSTVPLITILNSLTTEKAIRADDTTTTVTSDPGTCAVTAVTQNFRPLVSATDSQVTSSTQTFTLGEVLRGSSKGGMFPSTFFDVDFVTDNLGNLILAFRFQITMGAVTGTKVVNTITLSSPTPCATIITSTTTNPSIGLTPSRTGEQIAAVINVTTGEVLVRTFPASISLVFKSNDPPLVQNGMDSVTATPPACGAGGCSQLGGVGTPPTFFLSENIGVIKNGVETQVDSLWDSTLPFVAGLDNIITATDASQVLIGQNVKASVAGNVSWEYDVNWTKRTFTVAAGVTYKVIEAFLVKKTRPVSLFLHVLKIGLGNSENGVFLLNEGTAPIVTVVPFFNTNDGTTIKFISANAHRVLWVKQLPGGTTSPVFMTSLDTGEVKQVGTDHVAFLAHQFKLLRPDFLYAAKETERFFVSGWNLKTKAITLNQSAKDFPPKDKQLAELGKLKDAPVGVALPTTGGNDLPITDDGGGKTFYQAINDRSVLGGRFIKE